MTQTAQVTIVDPLTRMGMEAFDGMGRLPYFFFLVILVVGLSAFLFSRASR